MSLFPSTLEVQPDHAGLWTRDMPDPTAVRRKLEKPPLLKPPADSHRHNNIDFIRFALASLVIFSHSFALLHGGNENVEPLMRLTRNQLSIGGAAVDGFFTLSGFLITASWIRSSGLFSYLKKRILRIHPGFAVAMLFCFAVASPLGHADLHHLFSARHVLSNGFGNLFLLSGYLEPSAFRNNPMPGIVNGSLWTIRYEFACYLMIPLISLVAMRRRIGTLSVLVIVGCLVCGLGSYLQTKTGLSSTAELLTRGIDKAVRTSTFFMAGAIFYFGRDRISFSAKGVALSIVALIVGSQIPNMLAVVAPIAGTYLIFWLSFSNVLPFQRFGRFGDFSYGLYLYGCPIQQLLVQRYPHVGVLSHFIVAWSAAMTAGVLSWYCIERQFMPAKSKAAAAPAQPSTPAKRFSALIDRMVELNPLARPSGVAA